MLSEVLDFLGPKPLHTYVDGTLGMAGHAAAILKATDGQIQLFGFDRDPESLLIAEANLKDWPNSYTLFNARFSRMSDLIDKTKLKFPLAGILLDLGISSFQLDNAKYGLSFAKASFEDELDMRLDEWCEFSAEEILNEWPEKKLADLFWDYADFTRARPLARLIADNRPIKTIGEFVALCGQVNPVAKNKLHTATLPMMALRIAVNDELGELERGLKNIIEWMEPHSKLAVISFHSGEDRIVKNVFKAHKDKLEILTNKPLGPSNEEIKRNPRSRSAKLRVASKI